MQVLIIAITISVATIDFLLANYIYYEDRTSRIHRLAAARSILLSAYSFCTFMFYSAADTAVANFWGQSRVVPYLLLVPVAFHFVWYWTRRSARPYTRWLMAAIYTITVLNVLVNLFWDTLQPARGLWDAWIMAFGKNVVPFTGQYTWAVLLEIATLALAVDYFIKLKSSADRRRQGPLFLGVIFPATVGFLLNAVFTYVLPDLPSLVPLYILIADALVIYGITLNRAFMLTPLVASREIVEVMTDANLVVNPRGVILLANPAVLKLTGYSEEELVGKDLSMLFPPEVFSTDQDLPEVLRDGPIKGSAKTIMTRSHEEIHVLFSASRLHDRSGGIFGAVIVLTDITALRNSEARLKQTLSLMTATIQSIPNAMIVIDRQQKVVAVNNKFLQLWQIPDSWAHLDNPTERRAMIASRVRDPQAYLTRITELFANLELEAVDLMETRDGRIIERTAHPFRVEGVVMGKVFTYLDITHRKRTEAEERAVLAITEVLGATGTAMSSSLDIEQVLDTILSQISRVVPYDAINILDIVDGRAIPIRSVGFDHLYPDEADHSISINLEINSTPNLKWMVETRQPLVIPDVHQYPGWVKTPYTRLVHAWVGAPLMAHGKVIAFFSLNKLEPDFYTTDHARYLDIVAHQAGLAMENARLFAEVKQLAITDPLTDLSNRRHFLEISEIAFHNAQRYEHPLSVIMVDIDHFKLVNDRYGHFVGDYFLKNVGAIFLARLRLADVKGRFGGEEFMFVLPETRPNSALRLAERLRVQIAGLHLKTDLGNLSITVSIGLATLEPGDDLSLEALLIRADQAMYSAKEAGGNRVHVWQPKPTPTRMPPTPTPPPTYGLTLACPEHDKEGPAGQLVAFVVTLTNTGSRDDTYDISMAPGLPGGWQGSFCIGSECYTGGVHPIHVPAGSQGMIVIKIIPAPTAPTGQTGRITLNAVSQSDGDQRASISVTLQVR